MKYQIDIRGMHCKGCSALVKMSLEDEGFKDIDIEIKTNTGVFESNLSDVSKVEEILQRVFADLPGYSYKNIKIIN